MRVAVTGGAGYIGAFVVRALRAEGFAAFVLDDLSTGHRDAIPDGVTLGELQCGDRARVADFFTRHGIDAVIHLAALSLVADSVRDPGRYWEHNVGQSAGLLDACRAAGVRRFVFSSSAAVYGEPQSSPIDEGHPLRPLQPYGATKRAVEEMLAHYQRAMGLSFVALRYFNAAGAAADGSLGENHARETHLVPLAIAAALELAPPLTIYGADWPTPDGTAVRDYVHVEDLARAHVAALRWVERRPGQGLALNLGGGRGTSVRDVLSAVESVGGRAVPHHVGPRREGDPALLVAAIERARVELDWRPACSSIEEIVRDAWAWHTRRR